MMSVLNRQPRRVHARQFTICSMEKVTKLEKLFTEVFAPASWQIFLPKSLSKFEKEGSTTIDQWNRYLP